MTKKKATKAKAAPKAEPKAAVKKAEPKVESYLDRVKSEYDDLMIRIKKLYDFMHSAEFKTLDQNQRVLLSVQLNAMKSYRDALHLRIQA
jgi:hypothetical protein